MQKSLHINAHSESPVSTQVDSAVNGYKTMSHHIAPFARIIAKANAWKTFNQIKRALKDVELIETGKMKAKSIDDFLDEL